MRAPTSPPPALQNRLLLALPPREYERLLSGSELVHLAQGEVLYGAGDKARHAYFLSGGMVSWLSAAQNGDTLEVAMICNDGIVGVPAMLRAGGSHYRAVVQLPTNAIRVRVEVVREEFERGGGFQKLVLLYTDVLLIQIAQSALCTCFHSIEKRLCRWLLLAHDCAAADAFDLTHEFIAYMLGTSRPNVTAAAKTLQEAEVIRYSRGRVTIMNRAGLEARSCECYRIIRDALDSLFTT